jgi:hypothetical protein
MNLKRMRTPRRAHAKQARTAEPVPQVAARVDQKGSSKAAENRLLLPLPA